MLKPRVFVRQIQKWIECLYENKRKKTYIFIYIKKIKVQKLEMTAVGDFDHC